MIQSVGLTERDTECGTHRERYRVWDSQREIQSVGLTERDTECGTHRERYRVWDSQREIQSVGLTERDTECGTHRWLQLFEEISRRSSQDLTHLVPLVNVCQTTQGQEHTHTTFEKGIYIRTYN